ncbi:MAG: zinc-finger domain-containing protein [Parvibaculum sp.]|nr:zinc-finger domain-containing protein [Parvibaculum sp.]
MSAGATPKFTNDAGVSEIRIGVREFECAGAKPPFDHPHIFLDMGRDVEIICPYCSTLYKCAASRDAGAADPATAVFRPDEVI